MGFIMDTRIAEIWTGGKWVEIPFKKIKPGDIFKLYDDADKKEVVTTDDGVYEFRAVGEPFIGKDGVYEIECINADEKDY